MSENLIETSDSVSHLLKLAAALRDGFLVLAAICYFFGYIVWAITAYRNDLGLLPGLDFQYFVAGAPPLLILSGLYFIVIGVKLLRRKARDFMGPSPKGLKLYFGLTILGLGMISFLLIIVTTAEWFRAAFPKLAHSPGFIFGLAFVVIGSTFFIPSLERTLPTTQQTGIENGPVSRRAALAFREGVLNLAPSLIVIFRSMAQMYGVLVLIILTFLAFIFVIDLYAKIPRNLAAHVRIMHAWMLLRRKSQVRRFWVFFLKMLTSRTSQFCAR